MESLNITCVPKNPELLWRQNEDIHRAYNIFHDRHVSEPRCRKGDGGIMVTLFGMKKNKAICEKVMTHIRNAGFEGVLKSVVHKIDHPLITALVERWRPETNTFHLPIGEATVTLQDVQVMWGLPIDGPAVTGEWSTEPRNVEFWNDMCEDYLGFYPTDELHEDNLRNGKIKLVTLAGRLAEEFDENNDELCLQNARMIILALCGSELFHDSNTYDISLNYLQFLDDLSYEGRKSWGSATLACLYRNLSKATVPDRRGIDGPLLLLQYWAWERMSVIAPRVTPYKEKPAYNYSECLANRWHGKFSFVHTPAHVLTTYRSFFNTLTNNQFSWTPYTTFLHLLPRDCTDGEHIWPYIGPLIHWEEVEPHLAQRVARQFGMIQTIPNEVGLLDSRQWFDLRRLLKGRKPVVDWGKRNSKYVDEWDNRHQRLHLGDEGSTTEVGYMRWYHDRTVLLIGKPGQPQREGEYPAWGVNQQLYQQGLLEVDDRARHLQETNPENSQMFGDFRTIPREVFSYSRQDERMDYSSQNFMFPETQNFQMPPPSQNFQDNSWTAAGPSGFGGQAVFRPSPNSGFQNYNPSNPWVGASSSSTQHAQNPGFFTPTNLFDNLFNVPPSQFFAPDYQFSGPPARNYSPYPMQPFDIPSSSQYPITNLGNDEEQQEEEVGPRRSRRVPPGPPGCGTGGHR